MDDLLELLETVAEFWPFGVVALLTVGLAFWSRGRRYAHLPVLVLFGSLGLLLSFQLGGTEREAALAPQRFRCGLPFAIPFLALISIGAYTLGTGLVLLIWRVTRPIGVRVIGKVLPVLIVSCVAAWLVGRYAPWQDRGVSAEIHGDAAEQRDAADEAHGGW